MPAVPFPEGSIWYAYHPAKAAILPPVLLIHGAGGTHLDWPRVLRRLPNAATYVPDLPGHGRSTLPGRRSVEAYAEDIAALLERWNLGPVIVVGHSMGGAIAQVLALEVPDRVAGLVLIGTGARLRVHPDYIEHVRTAPEQVFAQVSKAMWSDRIPAEAEATRSKYVQALTASDPEVVYGDYVACDAFDSRGKLEAIRAPTLVIGGSEDRMTPLKFSQTLAESIPQAELVVVPGGSHMMTLEQPEAVGGAVRGWLARTDFAGT
jgi:pimeloyl-ACP methyl ester carboxylesterase